jgi:S-adenosylmethionine synthetase
MRVFNETKDSIDVNRSIVEIVERKGLGHPDSLVDAFASLLSILYSNFCLKRFGAILHHNIDKVTMSGGGSEVEFSNGIITEPAEVLFVGRGISHVGDNRIPIADMADAVTEAVVQSNVGSGFKFVSDSRWIKPGSIDLITNFKERGVPRANDTSFATAWAPFSKLENLVFRIEKFLNGSYKKKNPCVGSDIKVMGRRIKDDVIINLAVAFLGPELKNLKEYEGEKKRVVRAVSERFDVPIKNININSADDVKKGIVYITVSGSSAECGDDGSIGRGNRVTGVIAPARPNTLEAIAGKNPNKHVGNFYNIWAKLIADRIWKQLGVINDVQIVSTIGKPITHCDVFVRTDKDVKSGKVKNIVSGVVGSYEKITKDIIGGKIGMYPYDMGNHLLPDLMKRFAIN